MGSGRVRLHDRRRGRRPHLRRARQRALHAEVRSSSIPTSTGSGEHRPAQRALGSYDHLRDARQGLHQAQPATCRNTCAAPSRASDPRPSSTTSASLGVTIVELLPIHTFVDDSHLLEKGLTNYWGYNTIGFFAPDPRYASDVPNSLREFKEMVARLHDAGLEVILDVVYNHTAEGNERGPTLSFKGIDNAVVLPPAAGPAALLHQRHRHRQHAQLSAIRA